MHHGALPHLWTTTRRSLGRVVLFALPLLALDVGCGGSAYVQVRSARELKTTEAASGLEQVTRSADQELAPSVSPDGKLLAYEVHPRSSDATETLVVAPIARPSAPRFHIDGGIQPTWLADSSGVVFVTQNDGHWQTLRRDVNAPTVGALLVPVGDPAHNALWPSLSPDGNGLVTSLLALGVFDAHEMRKRTFDAALNVTTLAGYGVNGLLGDGIEPAWSPNGNTLAIIRSEGGHGHVFLEPATPPPARVAKAKAAANDDSNAAAEEAERQKEKTRARQLTEGPDEDAQPTWSPDGRFIAFCSAHASDDGTMGNEANLFVVGADGTGLTQLTEGDVFACKPSWGKNGWIYFDADSGDGFHIWRVRYEAYRALDKNEDAVGGGASDVADAS